MQRRALFSGLMRLRNYPLLMATWKVAPALAAGCAAILKPSELASVFLKHERFLLQLSNCRSPSQRRRNGADIRSVIFSVQRVAMAISPSGINPAVGSKLSPDSPEALTLANWICCSYSYYLGAELLRSDSLISESVLKHLWHHQDAILCCSLKSVPVFIFANQAGLDMLETTLVALKDITWGANILVDNKGCIKLADFGASKQVELAAEAWIDVERVHTIALGAKKN
ncbi:hypothetical protein AHAS_Ahas12G0114300 [Arachis hypogaea]